MAPANPYSETSDEVSYYWSAKNGFSNNVIQWGFYTQGGSGQSITNSEAIGGAVGENIGQVVAGGIAGEDTKRSWIITDRLSYGEGLRDVYQDDGIYQRPGSISDRFSKAATPPLPAESSSVSAISDPSKPQLYVGQGDKLYVYSAGTLLKTYTFTGRALVHDFVFHENKLYFNHADKVYRLDDGGPVSVFDIYVWDPAPSYLTTFCISGDRIYAVDGQSLHMKTGAKSRWIDFGDLNTQQQRDDAGRLRSSAADGVACSPKIPNLVLVLSRDDFGPRIYAVTPL